MQTVLWIERSISRESSINVSTRVINAGSRCFRQLTHAPDQDKKSAFQSEMAVKMYVIPILA